MFNFIAGDAVPVQPNPQGLMDQLMAMHGPAPAPNPSQPSLFSSLSGSQPIAAPPLAADPAVNQDLWQPTHRNILGRLADAMLIGHGQKPVYEARMQEKDLASAMQGFDPENPGPTIQRIAQIPGMAEKALSLYQQMGTESDRQDSRNTRDAAKRDLITQRLGGIAGVTTEQNFPQAQKLMKDYVTRWGEDPKNYDIPETYDKDALDLMSGGSISAKDQAAEQARQTALDIRQQQANSLDTYRESRLNQMQQGLNNQMTRFTQNLTMRENEFKKTHSGGGMVTDEGVPIVASPDGTRAFVLRNGVKYGYVNAGSQNGKINWVPVGPLQAPSK